MKKLILLITIIFAGLIVSAQVELKGVKIGENYQYSGVKTLTGIDFNVETQNLADGTSVAIMARPVDNKLFNATELNNLVAGLNKYYGVKIKPFFAEGNTTFMRAVTGKKDQKVVYKVEYIDNKETMDRYSPVVFIFNKSLYPKYRKEKSNGNNSVEL